MSTGDAPQIHSMLVGEVRTVAISFAELLDSLNEEKLTGTPTFAQYEWNNTTQAWDVSTDLTINNVAINTGTTRVNEQDVRTGAVVLALVTGVVADTRYKLVATCGTDSSPAQTLKGRVELMGVEV